MRLRDDVLKSPRFSNPSNRTHLNSEEAVLITRVLVQKRDGEFFSPSCCAAWHGFTERGYPVEFFEWPALRDGHITVEPTTLIAGGAGAVIHALRRLGIDAPVIDDLPEPLAFLRGRGVWTSTWGAVRIAANAGGTRVFVKPLRNPKAFPGKVIEAFRDLIPTAHWPDDTPVLVSDAVKFVAEWRFYILNRQVVGVACYSGDPLCFPDREVVHAALKGWPDAPVGCAFDLGVTDDARTLLVEVNDGFSLGSIGLRPLIYSRLLEARWIELVATARVAT